MEVVLVYSHLKNNMLRMSFFQMAPHYRSTWPMLGHLHCWLLRMFLLTAAVLAPHRVTASAWASSAQPTRGGLASQEHLRQAKAKREKSYLCEN